MNNSHIDIKFVSFISFPDAFQQLSYTHAFYVNLSELIQMIDVPHQQREYLKRQEYLFMHIHYYVETPGHQKHAIDIADYVYPSGQRYLQLHICFI